MAGHPFQQVRPFAPLDGDGAFDAPWWDFLKSHLEPRLDASLIVQCRDTLFGSRILYVNSAFTRLTQYESAHAAGLALSALIETVNPDQPGLCNPPPPAGCAVRGLQALRRKDCTMIPALVEIQAVDKGNSGCCLVTIRDAQAGSAGPRDQDGSRLAFLMDHIPDDIAVKDTDGGFVTVRGHLATCHVRLDSPEQAVDKPEADTAVEARALFEGEQAILESVQPIVNKIEKNLCADDSVTWISTTKAPVFNAAGRIVGTAEISRDITDRIGAEESRKRSEADLKRILNSARCIVWHATIVLNEDGNHEWGLNFSDEAAAARWLPLVDLYPEKRFRTRFTTESLPALPSLAAELQSSRDPVTKYLLSRFSTETNELLRRHDPALPQTSALKVTLVAELNRVLRDRDFYDPARFAGVALSRETRVLIDKRKPGSAVVKLNRLLLEDAYPHRIWTRRRSYSQLWWDSRHQEDQVRSDATAMAALESGASGYNNEFRRRLADGSWRWLAEDVHLELIAPDHWRAVGVITDISERKAIEEERERVLAEVLERADRDTLTGLLNHRAFHKRFNEEIDQAARSRTSVAVAVMDLDNFKFFNDAYGHTVGDDVLCQVATALQAIRRPEDILARFGGDEFALLMPGMGTAGASRLEARLSAALEGIGYQPPGHTSVIPMGLSLGVAVYPDEASGRLEVLALADERLFLSKSGSGESASLSEQIRSGFLKDISSFSMLNALVTAVDNKDRYTRRHSEDVLVYCLQIARQLGLDHETQRQIQVAALLHDVGKIGVPDAVLRKPGKLTDEEFAAIKQHPSMGAVIVSAVPGFEYTLDAVRHHHERWDGFGYPIGLAGSNIPLMARLMAVADAFSAMTTDRPYRKGMCEAQALAILKDGAGSQWDAECVAAFITARRLV